MELAMFFLGYVHIVAVPAVFILGWCFLYGGIYKIEFELKHFAFLAKIWYISLGLCMIIFSSSMIYEAYKAGKYWFNKNEMFTRLYWLIIIAIISFILLKITRYVVESYKK